MVLRLRKGGPRVGETAQAEPAASVFITLPIDLADRLVGEAKRRRLGLSAVAAEVVARGFQREDSAGERCAK
jgi:hypothetical protein